VTDEAKDEPPPPSPKPSPPPKKKTAPVITVDSADAQAISATGKKLSSSSAKFGSKLLEGTSLDSGASIEVSAIGVIS